jgi:H+/Cl- antiporter ClcA
MWIIKSIGLGLLAVIAALFTCIVFIVIALMIIASHSGSAGGVGWDPVSLSRQQPLVWVMICLVFAAGFAAGYRRFSPRFPQ